jgi:hypothetical protein
VQRVEHPALDRLVQRDADRAVIDAPQIDAPAKGRRAAPAS